jgi:GxxExxY protein
MADLWSRRVIGAAIEVHRTLGPSLLESAYEECLWYELLRLGLRCERQKPLPIIYKGVHLDAGYRLDIVVENELILELKAVEAVLPIHKAQMITYLRLTGIQLGLIINFNVLILKEGLYRLSNNYQG